MLQSTSMHIHIMYVCCVPIGEFLIQWLLVYNCTIKFIFCQKKYTVGWGDMHFNAAGTNSCQTAGKHHKKLSNFIIRAYLVPHISDR